MPSCNNYFGKLFAHLAAALAISALSAEKSDIGATLYGDTSSLFKFLGNLAILLALLFSLYATKPGSIPKYIIFGAFAFWFGQVMKPCVTRLKDKGTLTRILILTTGVFLGMMALGFYDSMNLLGFGPYLFAGLLGLIAARLLLWGLGSPEEKKIGFKALSFFGVALFAAFTAYDVQVLRAGAAECRKMQKRLKIDPDYPVESIGLYLDFINLFQSMGGADD
jgi:FtsH-binding integral membrane protein